MAQVPYSPVSDVHAQLSPTPSIHVDTPLAAFGGNIADAVQKLGSTSEVVGNELFQRAEAMQDLHNQSQADASSTQFGQQLSLLHAKFTSAYGENAGPDALMKYNTDVTNLRNQFRDSLNNPMAQRYYDRDTLRQQAYAFSSAAGHSAQQLDMSQKANAAALSDTARNIAVTTGSPEALADAVQKAKDSAAIKFRGQSPDVIQDESNKAVSSVYSDQIQAAVSRGDLTSAKSLLEQGKANGNLQGKDILTLQNQVNSKSLSIVPKQTAAGIADGTNGAMGSGTVTMDKVMKAYDSPNLESGGNYQITGPETKGGHGLGKYQVMSGYLQDYLRNAHMDPMTEKEYLANPGAQDQMFRTIFQGYMDKYGSANAAAVKWFTGKAPSEGGLQRGPDVLRTTPSAYMAKFNRALGETGTVADKVTAARTYATRGMAPDDPYYSDMGEAAENAVVTVAEKQHREQTQEAQQTQQTIDGALLQQQQAGKPISDVEDLRAASPEAAAALDKLAKEDPMAMLRVQAQIKTAAKADDTPSPERKANFEKLSGMAHSGDPSKFLDIAPYEQNLRTSDRANIIEWQKQLKDGKQLDNPHLNWAMQDPAIIQGLKEIGVSAKDNPDEYHKFTGALANEINAYQKTGKEPTRVDVEAITKRLLMEHVTGTHWYGGNTTQYEYQQAHPDTKYSVPVPDSQREVVRNVIVSKGGVPTEENLHRVYTRALFDASLKKQSTE